MRPGFGCCQEQLRIPHACPVTLHQAESVDNFPVFCQGQLGGKRLGRYAYGHVGQVPDSITIHECLRCCPDMLQIDNAEVQIQIYFMYQDRVLLVAL